MSRENKSESRKKEVRFGLSAPSYPDLSLRILVRNWLSGCVIYRIPNRGSDSRESRRCALPRFENLNDCVRSRFTSIPRNGDWCGSRTEEPRGRVQRFTLDLLPSAGMANQTHTVANRPGTGATGGTVRLSGAPGERHFQSSEAASSE